MGQSVSGWGLLRDGYRKRTGRMEGLVDMVVATAGEEKGAGYSDWLGGKMEIHVARRIAGPKGRWRYWDFIVIGWVQYSENQSEIRIVWKRPPMDCDLLNVTSRRCGAALRDVEAFSTLTSHYYCTRGGGGYSVPHPFTVGTQTLQSTTQRLFSDGPVKITKTQTTVQYSSGT